MTHQEVLEMMNEMNLPYAYHHFVEGESPDPPFLVFLYPGGDNFAADGKVYFKVNRLNIELYTDLKDVHGIFYEKSEVWIETENLYEVLYQTEV